MSILTAKGKRYFSPAHSGDDYHCLMGVMNIVKDAREKKGYSHSELARLVGRSHSAINKIESGDTMSLKEYTMSCECAQIVVDFSCECAHDYFIAAITSNTGEQQGQ